jgi:hypothetical protein
VLNPVHPSSAKLLFGQVKLSNETIANRPKATRGLEVPKPKLDDITHAGSVQRAMQTSYRICRGSGIGALIATINTVPVRLIEVAAQRAPINAAKPPMNMASA